MKGTISFVFCDSHDELKCSKAKPVLQTANSTTEVKGVWEKIL